MSNNKQIEKIGEKLYCINCGLNYNDQRKRSGTITCIDENTSHVYKKRENRNQCPKCDSSGMILCGDWDGSSYLQCQYCDHQEQVVELGDEEE